jgi:hypothetical protein
MFRGGRRGWRLRLFAGQRQRLGPGRDLGADQESNFIFEK